MLLISRKNVARVIKVTFPHVAFNPIVMTDHSTSLVRKVRYGSLRQQQPFLNGPTQSNYKALQEQLQQPKA